MKLISCDRCAVIIDADKLYFPPVWDEENDRLFHQNEDREYINCPVCQSRIYADEI